jgi:hypothetical protein
MRELIRKILRESADKQSFQEACSTSEEVNEMMKTFTLWRTAFCHKVTFPDVKNLSKKKQYDERLSLCGSVYSATPEQIRTAEACTNDIILTDYENQLIREKFNSMAGLPISCHVNDIRTCREKVDLTPIKQKEVPKGIEGSKTEPKLMKQISAPLPQVDTTLLQKIKKAFVNLTNNINYTTYKIKQKI